MKFTGERMLNHPESDLSKIHMERYRFAANFIEDKAVLDIACGSGYGTDYLGEFGASVIGVDIDEETIAYCKTTYTKKNIDFLVIHPENKDNRLSEKFDVVVSFETIEHVPDGLHFMRTILTYIKKGGIIILSTPNNFRKIHPSDNKFHVYEYDIAELYEILKKMLPHAEIEVFGQDKTDFRRNETKKESIYKIILKSIYRKIYLFDLYHLGFLKRIEHTTLYKKIGGLQFDRKKDFSIYSIDLETNFINPVISLYIIKP